MANNYIDPTEKGIEGLKGINRLGYDPTTSGGLPLSNDEAALLGALNKKFSDYDDSSLYYNPQAMPDSGWGDSVYDDNAFIGNLDLDVIQNRRADLQGAGVLLLNGILKGVSTAGTTIADGILGLPLGIIESLATGDVSKLWDNEITRATKAVSDASERILPNYRSVEEEAAPFWENLDSFNFWGDTIIKNAGFLIGAYYSGLPVAKVGQFLTSLAIKGAKFFNATLKAIENTAKVGSYATKGLHAGASAVVEGSIEAKNNSADWYNLLKAKTDDFYALALEDLDNTYLKGTPEYEAASLLIALAYNNSLKELDLKRILMGNMNLALNIPILTMSNIIQFAKILGGGFTTGVKSGLNIKGTLGNFRTSLGKHSYLKKGIKNSLAEGTEEMTLKMASDFSGNLRGAEYTNYAIDEFRNAKVDVNASKESTDAATSLGNAIYDNLTDVKSWEEFFVGALFGAVGMPIFGRKDNGKFGFKGMGGGIWNEYKENAAKLKEEQELVDYLNTRGAKELQETWKGLVRNKFYEDLKLEAIANNDEKAYHDANLKLAISDVIMFGKAGKLELLEALLEDIDKSADSKEFIEQLIEENKQTKTVDLLKEEIDAKIHLVQEEELYDQFTLKNIYNKKDSLEKRIKRKEELHNAETDPNKKNTLERELENLNSQYLNLEKELNEVSLEISKRTSERQEKVNLLEESKKDLLEYTFGPFMQGDTPMSEKDARAKVKSKIKETKALIDTYKLNSEELLKAFQGKLTREQEETLIFLKLLLAGNKIRIADMIKSLGNVRDDIISLLNNDLRNREEQLNEAKSQGKNEEEIKKLEEAYNAAKHALDTLNSIFYNYDESLGGKNAAELNTIELEDIGFTRVLDAFLSQYKTEEGTTIFGRPAEEVLGDILKKSKDIDALIKETNLYEKKYKEYKESPLNINLDKDSIEQLKANAKKDDDLDELKGVLDNGTRREKAEFVEEYEGNRGESPEIEKGLTQEEAKHLSQARFDNAVTKNLFNKAVKKLLSNNPSVNAQKIIDDIIKDIVCSDLILTKDDLELIVKTKGQELINELLTDPLSFKDGETSDSLAKKMLDFFGNLDLNKEQEEMREFFAKESKAEAERIKREEKELKDLAKRMSAKPEEDSEKDPEILSRGPKDGPEEDAALEPPKDTVTSASDLTTDTETSTATTHSDKESAKEINFKLSKLQSFAGRQIKGLKPFFSLYYQGEGPIVTYIEALKEALIRSANDKNLNLALFFQISNEYFEKLKNNFTKEDLLNTDILLEKVRENKSDLEKLIKQSAFYKHLEFLHTIYVKLGMQDHVKTLNKNDKLIIRAYNYDNSYGIIPIIYKVETDPNTNKVIEIPVGIAITELLLNTVSKLDTKKLLKDAYPEANQIVEFLKENKEGYLETNVNEVFGGNMPTKANDVSVNELYENEGTPKLGVVTNTSGSNLFEGNSAAKEHTIAVKDAKQGLVYVLVESPFGNYVPALAIPRTLSSILNDKNNPLYTELVKRITNIFLNYSSDANLLKIYLKDYIYLPALKITYDATKALFRFTYSKKLNPGEGEQVSKTLLLNVNDIDETKIGKFLEQLLLDTDYKDTLTINVNVNKIDFEDSNHTDYINFISLFLSVNLSSTKTINDWFSFNEPTGIKSTPLSNISNTPSNSNPNSPVPTDPNGGAVDPTGSVTNVDGNPINDNKLATELLLKALDTLDSNRVTINADPLNKGFNLSTVIPLTGQPVDNTLGSNSNDPNNDTSGAINNDDLGELEDDEYHSGIYRKVPKNSALNSYFERLKSKSLDMKPLSNSLIPKNLNSIEKENFNSCL